MGIQQGLSTTIRELSDQNYDQSLTLYRFWFNVAQAHSEIPPDQILDAIWDKRGTSVIQPGSGILIHPTAFLTLRFAGDVESDSILAPHNVGLQIRLCARFLKEFFEESMTWHVGYYDGSWLGSNWEQFYIHTNFVAHLANLGCVNESVIHDDILQSLTSHPKLYNHQADGLIILFKLAGATFEKYADPSVVDRCFELLQSQYGNNAVKRPLIQVRVVSRNEGLHQVNAKLQEVIELRERGWDGLPHPPALVTRKPKPTAQKDPAATPIVASLGLPGGDPEPQVLQPRIPQVDQATTPETDPIPATPDAQSPSISIATLSDFAVADTSDDESLTDPTVITPHDMFYLEDGNVEVLCGNTLFRVHTSILSFHSPALRRMFAQTSLATAESPNGCPRILSSDMAMDFATLLKMIYLPGFVATPATLRVVSLIVGL